MHSKPWGSGRFGRTGLLLTVVALTAAGCGGGGLPERDVAFPQLDDVASQAQALDGGSVESALAGNEVAWRDSREEVDFATTVTYGEDGALTGSWRNADAETEGTIDGSWEVDGDQLCVSYSGEGTDCYAVYRGNGQLYLVGSEDRVFERAATP